MTTITRGTTPSLVIDFSDVSDFDMVDISSVSLIIKQITGKTEFTLADMGITDNKLFYHFSQSQTLAFTAGETLSLDMHVVANGERYKVYGIPEKIKVENTFKDEVMM